MTALQLVPNNGDRWVLDTILGPPGDGAFATSVGRKPGTADFYPNTSEGRDAFVHTLQGARDRKQNVFISSAIWAESTLDLKDPTLGRETAPFLRSHCLWVDIDSPSQMNWALLNRLKRRAHMITHSGGVDGGRNRLHVRPLLAEPITDGHEFDVLNKWAAHALRGDNKWSQHTWLTMPGTTRYKEDEYPDGRTVSLITCNEDRAWHPDELRALFASYAPEPTVMSHHAGGGDIEAQEGAWDLLPRPCRYAYRNARSIGDDSEGFWRFVCTCAEYGVPEGVALGAAIKGRDEGAFPKRYSDAHLSGQIRKAYTKVEAEGKLGSKSTPTQREQKKKGPPDRRTNDQVAPTTSDDALEDIAVDHNTMVDTNDDEEVRVWKAKDLKSSSPRKWLAMQRIPRGKVCILVGEESIGKSMFWVWVVAAVTTGKPLPEFGIPARDPAHVRLVITEDDWSDEVLPRLEVAGADLDQISVVCAGQDVSGCPIFPRDMGLMYGHPDPALVVVDAFADTLEKGVKLTDPASARKALQPWRKYAIQSGAAVVLLTHTNRNKEATQARDKYGLSGELRKVARMTLFAQGYEDGTLSIGPEKTNGSAVLPATRFKVIGVQVRPRTDEDDGSVGKLVYVGVSTKTAREHAEEVKPEYADWLNDFLADGPQPSSRLNEEAKLEGITTYQLNQAKKYLGVESYKDKEFQGKWFVTLPSGG
ncbi:AAA family ATPase [Nocardia cyriacigeorgica]|uniref:AAA family ATPase n=1 Tax=Nocardia cyriacigeorgica TaxID=135487 RepID=UPI0018943A37|nr:AAA family ATPase [Nocardia cyriacigeorgica]MBF6081450.1 AAA family ATPase [Nocardia cyriacigeorgica]